MNREEWLRAVQRELLESYDTVWGPLYADGRTGNYPNATHQQFIRAFLDLFQKPAAILDAACGAGRYIPFLLERGHTVAGVDQSEGMLAGARAHFPGVQFERLSLQEMPFHDAFDGAICMDAMEHITPEDWPAVLGAFARALRPGAPLYFTVEIADPDEVAQAFERARDAGLPAVYGEWPDETVYHYYPSAEQVEAWLHAAGFKRVREGEGDGYRHLIVRKATDG
jgi:SAM-dependent methyltransferase